MNSSRRCGRSDSSTTDSSERTSGVVISARDIGLHSTCESVNGQSRSPAGIYTEQMPKSNRDAVRYSSSRNFLCTGTVWHLDLSPEPMNRCVAIHANGTSEVIDVQPRVHRELRGLGYRRFVIRTADGRAPLTAAVCARIAPSPWQITDAARRLWGRNTTDVH